MTKKIILLALCALLFALSLSAEAQQQTKLPRIGYLTATSLSAVATRTEAFRQGLRELGYVEGKNIVIEWRSAEGNSDRQRALAAELVRLKVDVIVSGGSSSTRLLRKQQRQFPSSWRRTAILLVTGLLPAWRVGLPADPVEVGLVESLARPGGNVTGLSSLSRELAGKRLELLKEAVPKLARVAVVYDPAVETSAREVKEVLPVAARALGLTIQPWEIRAPDDFEKVFAALNKLRPDGLYVSGSALMSINQKRIVGFAFKNRLPST